jgi:Fic family protein
MAWNWQQPDWFNFSGNAARLRKAEEHLLMGTGMFAGAVKHLSSSDQDQLTVKAMSAEAVTTSEIEGQRSDSLAFLVRRSRHRSPETHDGARGIPD